MRFDKNSADFISKKMITLVILISVFLNCCSCGLFREYTVEDIYGFWLYENEDEYYRFIAYIHDDMIDIYSVTKEKELILSVWNWSGSFEIPEGSFTSYEWNSLIDYDRTNQDRDWTHDMHRNIDPLRICFKANVLHVYFYGLDCKFERIDGSDKVLKMVEADKKCLEISDTLQDIEVLDMYCFPSRTEPYVSYVVLKVRNPNEHGIYYPEYSIHVQDTDEDISFNGLYLPPESERFAIGRINDDIIGMDVECQAYFNIYCVDVFDARTIIEVTGASVERDPDTGDVTGMNIDVEFSADSDLYGDYHLDVIFYREGEIVGVGVTGGQYQNGSTTVSVNFRTPITEFDDYEIYVS